MSEKLFTGKTGGWSNWTSPEHFLERVRKINRIALDPCGNANDAVKAMISFHWPICTTVDLRGERMIRQKNGLAENWRDWLRLERQMENAIAQVEDGLVYVNPPYSPMQPWVDKLCAEADDGVEILALIASKTDTNWWHQLVGHGDAGCFWRGRISFSNPPDGKLHVPSPSVASFVWYAGPNVDKFIDAFEDAGEIVRLRTKRS